MISTKARYALRVFIDLAQHQDMQHIPLKDIAKRQEISEKYLEAIIKKLVQGKLVKGISGKGGGYTLTRLPSEYSVGEIIEITEGTLTPVSCLMPDAERCPRAEDCITLPLWKKFDSITHDFFYNITIEDLVNGNF